MDMEKIIHYNSLYDCYKPLFTEKQQLYFQDYYFNNLSLGEIADNNNVSRNAVHNNLVFYCYEANPLKNYPYKSLRDKIYLVLALLSYKHT